MSLKLERKGRFLIQEVVDFCSNQNLVRQARRHNSNNPHHIIIHNFIINSDGSKLFRCKLYKFNCEVLIHDYFESFVDLDRIWNLFLIENKDFKQEYTENNFLFNKFCNIGKKNSNISISDSTQINRIKTRKQSTNPNYSKSTIIESSDYESEDYERLNSNRQTKKFEEKLKIEKISFSIINLQNSLKIQQVTSFEIFN